MYANASNSLVTKLALGFILVAAYVFLYMPVVHILFASLSSTPNFPYPPEFNLGSYVRLVSNSVYQSALVNSLFLATCTAVISTAMALLATMGVLRYGGRRALIFVIIFMSPLFVSELLLGIASMSLYFLVFNLPGNMPAAILANAVHCFSFSFLVLAAIMFRYDWRMNEAAVACGATPARVFLEVMLPLTWSGSLGSLIVSFVLALNGLDISFYLLGATPTMPSVAWGALRYGVKPELYALSSIVTLIVMFVIVVMSVTASRPGHGSNG